MSLRGDFAGRESHKETLRKFSLEMGVNKEGTQSGWGDPSAGYSPFTCKYSPCGAAFFKKIKVFDIRE